MEIPLTAACKQQILVRVNRLFILTSDYITRLLSIPTHTKTFTNCNIIIVVINNARQLQVTKNRYLDYRIIRNATCHLTGHLLEFSKAFLGES